MVPSRNSVFCWQGYLYLIKQGGYVQVGFSHQPGLDRGFWESQGVLSFELLSPLLNLGLADFLLRNLPIHGLATSESPHQLKSKLEALGRRFGLSFSFQRARPPLPPPPEEELKLVREVLSGRLLFLEEVARALDENGIKVKASLADILHYLYLQGECEIWPAVGFTEQGVPFCRRCGGREHLFQARCGACNSHFCYVCEGCLELGEARSCRALYARAEPRKHLKGRSINPQLPFPLKLAQREAYEQAAKFVEKGEEPRCLVWAVCGAGKTEVAYGAIAAALAQGREVLYASPRREVVKEIYPRLRESFPQVKIAVLHGETSLKFLPAELVVATVHQVLRFYQRFDLVILDEVDAFPLAGDTRLYYALERCRRPQGQVLYLTATPPLKLIREVRWGVLPVIYLPARHHGYPLPEPELVVIRNLKAQGQLPFPLEKFFQLSLVVDRAKVIVFVPTVELVGDTVGWLQSFFEYQGQEYVRGCYAASPEREEVLASFRQGAFPVLVTTTVMERGVTLPRLNVLVLFADHRYVFDENTLIQLAGRAGRTSEYPQARVWFVARKVSPEMAKALETIRWFNRMAGEKGYLKSYR
ncbi:competence protein ComFA [Thermanaeromonas toyohensis ToBE]|uniref:Competence protein ComFA n=1 Tax=Thermanaeromonas toyohensis ToBE TaxID=698762 RepID=A0A1W1VEQ5_9FIRM|nr:DEAD/DEAH box helicase [Thermanaeromonas toyohensis]SMB91434.1 competence protein ComFA [Thermanaeromonas toyohensis ToBE]